jgi:hypothetical protein
MDKGPHCSVCIPSCMGIVLRNEPGYCLQCDDQLLPTNRGLRTYQYALRMSLFIEEDTYSLEFHNGLLCSGCNSLPFMYTIPVFPKDNFAHGIESISNGWEDMELEDINDRNEQLQFIMLGFKQLQETRHDIDFVRYYHSYDTMCSFCLETAVELCPKCKCVAFCHSNKCHGRSLHRFACEAIEKGGIFRLCDLEFIKT